MTHGFGVCFQRNHSATEYYTTTHDICFKRVAFRLLWWLQNMTHGFFVCFQRNHSVTEYYTDRFENKEIIVTRREIKFFVFWFAFITLCSPVLNWMTLKLQWNKKNTALSNIRIPHVLRKNEYPLGSGQKIKTPTQKVIKIFHGWGVKGHPNGNPNFAFKTKVSKRAHNTPSRTDAGWSTKIA